MKKINVLFIGCTNDQGGAPKSMIMMIKYLYNNHNINPIVVTSLNDGIVNRFCLEYNIKCYVVNYKECCFSKGKNFIKTCIKTNFKNKKEYEKNHTLELDKISIIIEKEKIDIIHTNVNRFTLGCELGKKYNIPNIIHLREFADKDYNVTYYNKNIYKYFNDNCNKFIAISNTIKDYWSSKGIDKNKIVTIYNGFEIKDNFKLNNIDYKKGIKAVFVGNIAHNKGQIQVLKCINKLPKEIREKIHVDFYGSYGKRNKLYIEPYLKLNHLNKYISFKGYINDVENLLSNYNLGFMCSKSEGFGRVTVDYMLNGIPVIASNTGANPEIIINRKTGFIYKYNDINDLTNKIIDVYNCKKINEVVKEARNTSIEKYNVIKSADEIYKVYVELLHSYKK